MKSEVYPDYAAESEANLVESEANLVEPEVYLDYAATSKPIQSAIDTCIEVISEDYGNPSSLHSKGFSAEKRITAAREKLSNALGCTAGEIIFTSSATEADNLAVFGAAAAKKRVGKRIVTTAIEHPAVLEPIKRLEQEGYTVVRLLPDATGGYSAEQFVEAMTSDTALVCVMWVNNETGLTLPVCEIAKAVKRANPECIVHVDGVQGFCRFPIKLKSTEIDLFSISGHKLGAPKGVGALYCKKGVRLIPQMLGGGQENGMRSGTEPVPLIAAFGSAVEEVRARMRENNENNIALKGYFKEIASDRISNGQIKLYGNEAITAPHIMSIGISGIRSEVMLHFLEQSRIYVSSGSACSKGKQSGVLVALGYGRKESDEVLRISFGHDTSKEYVKRLFDRLCVGIDTLARKR